MDAEKQPYRFKIDECLCTAIKLGASDIHLRAGIPPVIRKNGAIERMDLPAISDRDFGECVETIIPKHIRNKVYSAYDFDFPYEIKDISRFRVNLCRQLGKTALVFRVIPHKIKTITELNLPQALLKFTDFTNGLVLITGATGCGKSTTIAGLIDYINTRQAKHIISIEDPIEFIYTNKKSIVTQRQISIDVESFPTGIKYAMRQDPDIIVVGEIRDEETVLAALKAAETGHLVFATLHTNDAISTINRIINLVNPESQEYIRHQLAGVLRATVSQKLVKRIDIPDARIPACEVMIVTPTIQDLMMKNNQDDIYKLMQDGKYSDMQTMNMYLTMLFNNNLISDKTALANSLRRNELTQMLKGVYHGTKK